MARAGTSGRWRGSRSWNRAPEQPEPARSRRSGGADPRPDPEPEQPEPARSRRSGGAGPRPDPEPEQPEPARSKRHGGAPRAADPGIDAAALREELRICIEEDPFGDCPAPVSSFEELTALPEFVLRNLQAQGMSKPMPIQAQALPLVLHGRDVVGLAQTGSGKTLAFLLPVPVHVGAGRRGSRDSRDPIALVLAPTRELAVQIAEAADKILYSSSWRDWGVRTSCVYGGGDRRSQTEALRRGVQMVVATPGRLLDFVSQDVVRLDQVDYFVLDEADRMLDMGFHEDVTALASRTQAERQVLFFSATWNTQVQQLAQGLCRSGSRPVRISYAQGGGDAQDAESEAAQHRAREEIIQEVIVVDKDGDDHWETQGEIKRQILEDHLQSVLRADQDHKVLVFVSTKQFADEVSTRLWKNGFSADAMHGGKSQSSRLWVLDQFRKGELRLLICTDVLGRGIDIPSVSHVVIYEMGEIQDYIHRIGRTARGRHGKGHALVFYEYWEGAPAIAAELIDVLVASKQDVPQDLRRIADEIASGKRRARQPAWSNRRWA